MSISLCARSTLLCTRRRRRCYCETRHVRYLASAPERPVDERGRAAGIAAATAASTAAATRDRSNCLLQRARVRFLSFLRSISPSRITPGVMAAGSVTRANKLPPRRRYGISSGGGVYVTAFTTASGVSIGPAAAWHRSGVCVWVVVVVGG